MSRVRKNSVQPLPNNTVSQSCGKFESSWASSRYNGDGDYVIALKGPNAEKDIALLPGKIIEIWRDSIVVLITFAEIHRAYDKVDMATAKLKDLKGLRHTLGRAHGEAYSWDMIWLGKEITKADEQLKELQVVTTLLSKAVEHQVVVIKERA